MESTELLVSKNGTILQETFVKEGRPAKSIEYQYIRSRNNHPGTTFMDSIPGSLTTVTSGASLQKEILNNAQGDTRAAVGRSLRHFANQQRSFLTSPHLRLFHISL